MYPNIQRIRATEIQISYDQCVDGNYFDFALLFK